MNNHQQPERIGGTRAERRHPSPPEHKPSPNDIHIHLQTSDRGPKFEISSFAANVILGVLNSVPVAGSTLKMQLALAQLELEEGLRSVATPAVVPPAPSAAETEAGPEG